MDSSSVSQSPNGQIGAPDRAGEEHVAGEERALGVIGEVCRRVSGDGLHLERDTSSLDGLSAGEDVASPSYGRIGMPGKKSAGRRKTSSSPSGSPDGSARALGEVGERAEVVVVAVGEQDRGAGRARSGEREPDLGRVCAGIDDDRLGRASIRPHEVAVRADLAELSASTASAMKRTSLSLRVVQTWKLTEIEMPDGKRDPVVLHSDPEARAVLLELEPGESLGDHQVKEHAWLFVVEGNVRVGAAGESVDAEPGTLFRFMPDERHSVASDDGRSVAPPARAVARRGSLPRQRRLGPASASSARRSFAERRW